MARQTIQGLKDLALLDNGIPDAQFKEELRKVIEDLRDRPALELPREINIRFIVRPQSHDDGTLAAVGTEVEISSKVPKTRTQEYSMGISSREPTLVYNDHAPENHNQRTLDEANEND